VQRPVILCVDDERTVLTSLRQELELGLAKQYSFELAESAEEALEILSDLATEAVPIHAIVSDHMMPGMKGIDLLQRASELVPNARLILLTGDAIPPFHNQTLIRYLPKPWNSGELVHALTSDEAAHLASIRPSF
jgi:adenylate cyclase